MAGGGQNRGRNNSDYTLLYFRPFHSAEISPAPAPTLTRNFVQLGDDDSINLLVLHHVSQVLLAVLPVDLVLPGLPCRSWKGKKDTVRGLDSRPMPGQ